MFQFPANPVLDQQFSPAGGPTYTWNGTGWAPFTKVYNGGLTFTGPVLFPDGTVAAPAISWANEPVSGFRRAGTNWFEYIVGGTVVFGFNKTTWGTGGSITTNLGGPTNCLSTLAVTGAATFNGAVTFNSTVTGVVNVTGYARQIWTPEGVNATFNWAGRGGQPAWLWGNTGANDTALYNPSNFSVNRAAYVSAGANHGGNAFKFTWYDDGGQPSYLWGATDGINMQVYPPGRLRVDYANSSNTCSTANNSYNINGIATQWRDPGGGSPNYVLCATSPGDSYVRPPSALNVNYANSCDYSNRTGSINNAGGGTVNGGTSFNGRMTISQDSGSASNDWGSRSLIVQGANSGGIPAIAFHHPGVCAWGAVVMTNFFIGEGSGPGGLSGYAFRADRDGSCYGRIWYTVTSRTTDSVPMTGALSDLVKLRGVRYLNDETQKPDIGLEVDEVERAFPELVSELRMDDGTMTGKAINYMALTAPIIEALRELNERLTALENA